MKLTNYRGKKHHLWKGGLPTCEDCGKKLSTRLSKVCNPCSGKRKTKANNPNWKGGLSRVACLMCKKIFHRPKSEEPKYCSLACASLGNTGDKNKSWKGDGVGYRDLHLWVERQLGKPNKCLECGKIRYGHQIHWANVSGEYMREVSDWLRLCVKCHKTYDRARDLINK